MRSDMIKMGIEKSPQRALLKGMGYIGEEIANPFIGVISSYNEISPGHRHLRDLAQSVKDGVRLAGGTPVEINTVSVCDGIALGHTGVNYALASREIVADSIETIAGVHGLDAIVLIPNCEKVVSGMLMGAARVDIPSILVCGGAASPGNSGDQEVDLGSVFEKVLEVKNGLETAATLAQLEESACPGCGACAGMPNAHAMSFVAEALGMTLPGNSTCPSGHAMLKRLAKRAGLKIMELLSTNLRPSQIITEKALSNALSVDAAMGGSPSVLLHLRAIAAECGLAISHQTINDIYGKVPVLCKLRPESTWQVQDLHSAGGIPAILSALGQAVFLQADALTVTGKTLQDCYKDADSSSIMHLSPEDSQKRVPLAAITGNLAPEGAVLDWKGSSLPLPFSGPARVFESEKAAIESIRNGKIQAGDVVVIRYEGPRGGPGMQELAAALTQFNTHPICRKIALVTDGRFSGWYQGLNVQHVSPEAAAGGPLAYIVDGDMVTIDGQTATINVNLGPQELANRMKGWIPPVPKVVSGYLAKYARQVSSAAAGAVTR
jgi:dihydroxy-acid dehydratase